MTLGLTPSQASLLSSTTHYCRLRLSDTSIYTLLHQHSPRLFPDPAFADLFRDIGRRSIPPRIVAVVMVLQRIEGLSDREAVDRFAFDLRWKYAAGGLDYDFPGFVHTVLVDMRARLRRSDRPHRIFEAVLEVCREAGLVGRRRVLDSTALYDAVATQDTVTLIRSAIRNLLRVLDPDLRAAVRAELTRDDDYVAPGKPACAWDVPDAQQALVDALAHDGDAALRCLQGRRLEAAVTEAVALLGTVLGQDLDRDEDGTYRIARRVAPDRVISTVDPEARHGRKTGARGFDGYKGHLAIDPDSEIIVATEVTAGNVGDAKGAGPLLDEAIAHAQATPDASNPQATPDPEEVPPVEVYGDAAYGTADIVETLEAADIVPYTKVQPPTGRKGQFTKRAFHIDLDADTVRCPAGVVVPIRRGCYRDRAALAAFGAHCVDCPLRASCTSAHQGRTIAIHEKEATLQHARQQQQLESWQQRYRATRPKVERKIAHLMRRRHGGRRARVRGQQRVGDDFALLCAAANLQRLATRMLTWAEGAWQALVCVFCSLFALTTPPTPKRASPAPQPFTQRRPLFSSASSTTTSNPCLTPVT